MSKKIPKTLNHPLKTIILAIKKIIPKNIAIIPIIVCFFIISCYWLDEWVFYWEIR